MHTRNPVSEFWDGFQSSQWCLVMDDIAFMNVNKSPNGDKSVLEFIQVINPTPFCPNQASLEDKGKTPMLVDLVIGTTNTENLNAHHYFSHPSAVQRRFPFIIEPKPKPEFARECGMLDSSKTNITGGGYPDYWTWTIKVVSPVSIHAQNKNATITIIHKDVDLKTFLLWFNSAIEEFDRNQCKMVSSLDAMRNTELCPLCQLPIDMCSCHVQSSDERCVFIAIIVTNILAFIYAYCIKRYVRYKYTSLYHYYLGRRLDSYKRRYVLWYDGDQKKYFRSLGESVKQDIGYPALFASLAAFLACGLMFKRFLKKEPTLQGSITSKSGSQPVASSHEKTNVWYKDDYVLSTFDVTPQSVSSKSMSSSTFTNLISRSCVHIETSLPGGKGVRGGKAACLKGNLYFTNNHNIPVIDEYTTLTLISMPCVHGLNENFTMKLTNSQVERYPEKDLCIITIVNIPPRRGIYDYLPTRDFRATFNGFLVQRKSTGFPCVTNVDNICRIDNARIPVISAVSDVWEGRTKIPSVDGDCGSLLVSQTEYGFVIVGFHIMGEDDHIVSIAINKEMFAPALLSPMAIQSSEPLISAVGHTRVVGPLHYKANVRYIDNGLAAVYGSFQGFRGQHKSRVEKSYLHDYLVNKGYPLNYGIPEMRSWEPWNHALQDLTKPNMLIDNDIVEIVCESFYFDINAGLGSSDYDMLHVYDDMTTLNGAAGISYVDKINRNTSAGAPWKKGKKHFMYAIPAVGELYDPVALTQDIMDRVDESIACYHRGKRTSPVFTASLKDEAVSLAKVQQKKTRVFAGAPLDFTFIVRKYLLSFVRLVQNRRELFESAPGLVTQSEEWDGLFHYITKHGVNKIIAGDYRKFDKTMAPVWIVAAFQLIVRIMRDSGNFSEDDFKVISGVGIDIAYPLMDFNGELIQFFGSNPSGHPLTVIINGLANSMYMRYTYYLLNPKCECLSFKKNVSLMTYGDDNICSVSNLCPWYNHTTIAACFATIGIGYTMADKEAVSIPYINIKDASFLKRRWVFNKELDRYLAPLEHDSIEKMLLIWVASKTISPQHQAVAIVESAIGEYFFYGKEVFNDKRDLFIEMCGKLDLRYWVKESTFPTWEYLVTNYWKNSERIIARNQVFLQEVITPKTQSGLISRAVLNLIENKQKADRPSKRVNACDMRNITETVDGFLPNPSTYTYALQSSDVTHTDSTADANISQENVTFTDGDSGKIMEIPLSINECQVDDSANVELGAFLTRPVLIQTFTWSEGSSLAEEFSPWLNYFSNTVIKKKLDNYFLLRCNLHLKIVLNASPFYYSAAMVSYRPLSGLTTGTDFNPCSVASGPGLELVTLCGRSQRPRVFLYPQTSEGADMILPFFYDKNWIDVTVADNLENMGTINIDSLFFTLANANSVVAADTTIQVYAWAEDVKVAGPTISLALQSKDEYGKGAISEKASAISNFASTLSNVPVIGNFATATSMMANTISGIASLFGYTNVPVIADVHYFKNAPFPHMSTTQIGVPAEKLTLDPKNELTIDPKVNGIDLGDELAIVNIVTRESFLNTFTWSSIDPPNDLIFSWRVAPTQHVEAFIDGYNHYQATPMAMVAQMFNYWRGDITIRIKFLCTKYHRGRVKVSWDPIGNISGAPESTESVYTKIIDIADNTDVEFTIPYTRETSYLDIPEGTGNTMLFAGAASQNPTLYNGIVTMRVLTQQSSPVADAPIGIAVFVKGAENLQFANPRDVSAQFSTYRIQSDDLIYDTPVHFQVGIMPSKASENLNLIHMGEKVVSLRTVMRRQNRIFTQSILPVSPNASNISSVNLPRMPLLYGYDPNGIHFGTNTVAPGSSNFNYVNNCTLNWVNMCFIAHKGSVIWNVNVRDGRESLANHVDITRNEILTNGNFSASFENVPTSNDNESYFYNLRVNAGQGGMALTNQNDMSSLNVSIPMYSKYKFLSNNVNTRTLGSVIDASNVDSFKVRCITTNPNSITVADRIDFDFYCGIGTDFSPVFFLNVPTLYQLAVPPFTT